MQRKNSQKRRGDDWLKVTHQEPNVSSEVEAESLLAVNDALDETRLIDPNLARLVEPGLCNRMTEISALAFSATARFWPPASFYHLYPYRCPALH